ncbi:hypothetical protein POM88_048712 [Heracleum sosnowskyi]|uniref:Uncharacterized protein n=1 Tax=Heracleum sosnowskyi TaxID=360622 RepID=A0AAD8LZW0_9APIA|nr:hypothetical protein POM88_048712 [Heracleum sosnowskyi]
MEKKKEGGKENYSEVEKIQLIDFSSEDDILVDYPFRDSLEDLRLSVTFKDISDHNSSESLKMANQRKVENAGNILHHREEMLSTPEFLEPRRASYLRKSIAWDNAFFSSDGVLDPEELSAMNNGFKGLESSLFPGIPEDLKMRRSVDSDLTFESLESDAFSLDSDAFSLESFDGDLFEDVRASIHRSCGPLHVRSASCDSVTGKSATTNVPASKKFYVSTQNKGKSGATSRKQPTNYQKSKMMTESSLPSLNLQHKGENNLTPRILGGQNNLSSRQIKRDSLGYGSTRNRNTGQGLMVPKQSASVDSPSSINFLTPLTKLSSTVSLTATKSSSVAGSSCDEFSSNSSCKSILSSGTRNIGSSSSKIASSGSNSKPPLRYSGRSRSRLSNQTSSIQLMSMLRHSNNSPASSIDGWSSESSSSTCSDAAKRRSCNLVDKLRTDTIQASGLHQFTHRRMSAGQHLEGAVKEASSVLMESPNTSKPSGLRMPSPKIGFFDEDKPVVQTSIDTMQFRFRSQSAVSDLNVNAVKNRPSKIQPLRYVHIPGPRNNIGSPLTPGTHCTSSTRPQRTMHSNHLDNGSTKSAVVKSSLGPALKLRTDTSFEVDNAYCSKTRKIGKGEDDRKKVMLTSSLKTEEKRNKGILKNKLGKERKDHKAGNGILLETVEPIKKDHESARELPSRCESKENFEDQVNGLSRYFEVIDLGGNAKELEPKKSNGREHNETAEEVHFLSDQQQDSPNIARIPLADKLVACHQPSPPQAAKESS